MREMGKVRERKEIKADRGRGREKRGKYEREKCYDMYRSPGFSGGT